MIDRTQLTEAAAPSAYEYGLLQGWLETLIADTRDYEARLLLRVVEQHRQMRALLLDFPTDEMVEAAARSYHAEVGRRSSVNLAWETSYDSEQADFLRVTGEALEAVRRVMIGDTDG